MTRATVAAALAAAFFCGAAAHCAETPEQSAARQQSMDRFESAVAPILKKACLKCHGDDEPEGEVAILQLAPDMKATTSAARWAMVVEKVASREMPPKDCPPLGDAELSTLTDWIAAEMKRSGKHLARREAYNNGNKVAHGLLFDPAQQAPLDVAPRIRTVSPDIYEKFILTQAKGFENLVGQPFSPGVKSTFKDMALPKVDEPVTAQLLRNALVVVERQTGFTIEEGELKPMLGARKEYLPFVDEKTSLGEADMQRAITMQFERVLERKPSAEELSRFTALMKKNVDQAGRVVGVRYSLAAVFLLPEAIFRYELGDGDVDGQGRVRLAPREIAFALSYALTDERPDGWLIAAAEKGKLDSRDGVADAVRQMLDDPKLAKPRILRFFREYFDYAKAADVFKETKDIAPGHDARALVEDTDRLVEYVLEQDKQVLKELLTTNKSFVFYKGAADLKEKRQEALAKFEADKKKDPKKFEGKTPNLPGRAVYESYNLADFPDEQPVELPKNQRAGVLTQPAWLVAWSVADDNHAILRGKWVRERLLGGVVPDIPITVDAQLPNAPDKTLRERMLVTHEAYCWQCHQLMNRVGLPFEMYDHFGRFRTGERVLDAAATETNVDAKGKRLGDVYTEAPVDASGGFEFTHDPHLTGDVKNAVEFLHKMAESEVVEQVFVRHAFRYWMGRNETLGDAASLQAAQRAYRDSDGSMRALLVSLLSSDSFLYRIPPAGN
ncbi:MAG: DUF1588 domain-containing protein [Planctomycetales bacterium]|nr:DUF1588 domain-containing protein [Planctomycetales bacterium]